MADHKLLRLSATLLFVGELLFLLAGFFHQMIEKAPANNHSAAFADYAASGNWIAVHLGQFVGTAILIAGLLVLFFALNVSQGPPRWVGFFGAISAGVTLALAGVVYAVDGVALKQAVDAWASAPAAEQAARFASAEAIRWLEWGTKSYQNFMLGLALVLFAIVIVWTARVPRLIGYLMGLSGLALLVHGWVLGTEGFSATDTVPNLLGLILPFAWSIWLLIVAWRMKESAEAAPA
jgi:cadmium resistance protein CadD (predicted permease)